MRVSARNSGDLCERERERVCVREREREREIQTGTYGTAAATAAGKSLGRIVQNMNVYTEENLYYNIHRRCHVCYTCNSAPDV